jgi:hypothetical protein
MTVGYGLGIGYWDKLLCERVEIICNNQFNALSLVTRHNQP